MTDERDDFDATDVWVMSHWNKEEGRYRASVKFGLDYSLLLDEQTAVAYCRNLLMVAASAEYDAAIMKMITSKMSQDDASLLVVEARSRREAPAEFDGLLFTPGVTQEAKAFIAVTVNGSHVGQYTVNEAREHATQVLESMEHVTMDNQFFASLTEDVELAKETAWKMINALGQFRE